MKNVIGFSRLPLYWMVYRITVKMMKKIRVRKSLNFFIKINSNNILKNNPLVTKGPTQMSLSLGY